jgi:hypothetical protein
MIRMQHELLDVRRVEMKHAGLAVIDPNDGMKVMFGHETGPFWRSKTRKSILPQRYSGALI